jgi:hypothetical protein
MKQAAGATSRNARRIATNTLQGRSPGLQAAHPVMGPRGTFPCQHQTDVRTVVVAELLLLTVAGAAPDWLHLRAVSPASRFNQRTGPANHLEAQAL